MVSTNEAFDGHRTDGLGYAAGDPPAPANPYGASKLGGESAARVAYAAATGRPIGPYTPAERAPDGPQLAIVRTAWLYGPPGDDFPAKIVAAAERAHGEGSPLRVVGDEVGQPTATTDLAEAIVELDTAAVEALAVVAEAAGTVPKAAMKYQDHPHGNQDCSSCMQFIPGKSASAMGQCNVVAGPISPTGWCIAYAKKRGARASFAARRAP